MRRSKIALHPQHHRDSKNRQIASIWRPTNLSMRKRSTMSPVTPVPSWKLYENPFYDSFMNVQASSSNVSARKLAATLWERQEYPVCSSEYTQESSQASSSLPSLPLGTKKSTSRNNLEHSKSTDKSNGRILHTSRQIAAMQSHINRLLEKQVNSKHQNNEADKKSPEKKSTIDNIPVSSTLLERLNSLEDGALTTELENARNKVRELEHFNKTARRDIESILKKIADEKSASHNKEQDKIKQALRSVQEETEEVRKSKVRMELANKRLSRELGEAKIALSKAMEDLDKERKARELMEDVCDELAREIGEDKAEVEQLKRESERIKQEVEEERKMLQTAEVWREERVHMKLAEAKDELNTKTEKLEELKGKLEDFLKFRRRVMDDGDYASQRKDIGEAETLRAAVDTVILRERSKPNSDISLRKNEEPEDDLHSIDLTKDIPASPDRKSLQKLPETKMVLESSKKIYYSPNEECSKRIYCSPNESSDDEEYPQDLAEHLPWAVHCRNNATEHRTRGSSNNEEESSKLSHNGVDSSAKGLYSSTTSRFNGTTRSEFQIAAEAFATRNIPELNSLNIPHVDSLGSKKMGKGSNGNVKSSLGWTEVGRGTGIRSRVYNTVSAKRAGTGLKTHNF